MKTLYSDSGLEGRVVNETVTAQCLCAVKEKQCYANDPQRKSDYIATEIQTDRNVTDIKLFHSLLL